MDKKINILVICRSNSGGVGYYRSYNPHKYLALHYQDIFNVDIVYGFPNTNIESFYSKYDIVHFNNCIDEKGITLSVLKKMGIISICDIDDYWMLSSHHPMYQMNMINKQYESVIHHIRYSDYVTTTTEIFAERIRQLNKNVIVIPNAIDVEEEQFKPVDKKSDKIRVGVICGSTHKDDIELLSSIHSGLKPDVSKKVQFVLCGYDTNGTTTVLNRKTGESTTMKVSPTNNVWYSYEKILSDNFKRVTPGYKQFLQLFVDKPFPGDESKEGYVRKWTKPIESYATHYNDIDILLAPLVECDFNKYKSQLKAIEAGVFNKALIAQNYGPYKIDLINADAGNGELNYDGNALLVSSNKNRKNWAKYINMLVENEELRNRIASNLHDTIMSKYTLEKVSKQRADAYIKIKILQTMQKANNFKHRRHE